MTQIDTKTLLDEIAGIAITTNGKPHIPRTLRDELVTHLLDTAPLSREEREDELRKAGFVERETILGNAWEHGEKNISLMIIGCTVHSNGFIIPLSAVCRRLLRDCGVIA